MHNVGSAGLGLIDKMYWARASNSHWSSKLPKGMTLQKCLRLERVAGKKQIGILSPPYPHRGSV